MAPDPTIEAFSAAAAEAISQPFFLKPHISGDCPLLVSPSRQQAPFSHQCCFALSNIIHRASAREWTEHLNSTHPCMMTALLGLSRKLITHVGGASCPFECSSLSCLVATTPGSKVSSSAKAQTPSTHDITLHLVRVRACGQCTRVFS